MTHSDSLYKTYLDARANTWKIFRLLYRYGKVTTDQPLENNEAYLKAVERQDQAYRAWEDSYNVH